MSGEDAFAKAFEQTEAVKLVKPKAKRRRGADIYDRLALLHDRCGSKPPSLLYHNSLTALDAVRCSCTTPCSSCLTRTSCCPESSPRSSAPSTKPSHR